MTTNNKNQIFRTIVETRSFPRKINYQKNTVFLGSCFSENIGAKLKFYKFPLLLNPFGIMYNPLSISILLNFILSKKTFSKEDFFYHNDRWQSFNFHGSISSGSLENLIKDVQSTIDKSSDFLKKSDFLFITLGTAWVYKLKKNGRIVANCHKISPDKFSHELLGINEITKSLTGTIQKIHIVHPDLDIIFTLSPIRHWKHGAVDNFRSKALLLLAIFAAIKQYTFVHYFPAYEIMMDDLRDYRFYQEDMLHPNSTAIDYIWNSFVQSFLDKKCFALMKKIEKIQLAKEHRPFQANSKNYRDFIEKQVESLKNLINRYPDIDLKEELDYFTGKIF